MHRKPRLLRHYLKTARLIERSWIWIMKYPLGIALIGFLAVALLGLPTAVHAAIAQDDIGASLTQPDGSGATIPNVEIVWRGKSGRSFAIKETGEPQPPAEHPRLVVVSTRPLPVSSHWNCDVSGVLSTHSGVSKRDGRPFTQRVLIVSPENVAIYCSSKGRPIPYLPLKSLGIDWPYKRTLADLASDDTAETASAMTVDEEPLPPLPDSPSSSSPPIYCATIADARAAYSPTARLMVELQCRPFGDATTTQFTLGQDSPADSITVYYSGSSTLSGRINKIVGTIQKNEHDEYWIEVDSGPNWQTEDVEGSVQAIPEEAVIAYARTFGDGESVTLTGQIVSADRTDFPNAIYVQEPNRAAGIRVLYTGSVDIERGDEVDVSGTIGTGADMEREIDAGADGVTYVDHPGEPKPLGMPNRTLGGGDFNVFTPSVNWPYGSGVGLYNKGLLVRIWGRVTLVDVTNKCFYIDDGTGFDDDSGHVGVKVSWDWPTSGKASILPSLEGWYVSVAGISGSEDFGSQRIIRTLRPRDQNDVVIYQAGTPVVYDPVDAWQEEFTPSDSFDAGGTGPSSADSVDLATGAYNNDPDPDIVAVNPFGPDAEFTRLYRSKLVETGIGSVGLSVGWVHNYDVKIVRDDAGWGDLRLVFPDGAADTLRPVIENNVPTGVFTPMGGSYVVTGETSGTPGLWNWIRIMFPDETKWEFTSAAGSPYRLRKISDIQGNSIYVNRNADTSLQSISTDSAGVNKLLDFNYSTGSLIVTDVPASRTATYSFVSEAGATILKSVSQVSPAVNLRWRYTYQQIGGIPYLTQVEVPDPAGIDPYRGHPIIYDEQGRVEEIKDANNNSRSYIYGQVGGQGRTQVFDKDPTGRIVECWTQKIGTNKEELGTVDANGKETTIEYNVAKRPWRFTNKNNKQISVLYDSYGSATQVTDETNLVTLYGYTNPGSPFRPTSVQTGTKTSTTFDYYANGLLWHVNSPKPNTSGTGERVTTTYTYTAMGNVETITTPPGLGTDANPDIREVTTTVYKYDQDVDYSYSTTEKLDHPIVISVYQGDPINGKLLSRTHLRYDSRGRLIEVADPLIGSPPDPSDYYLRHRTTLAYNTEDQVTDIWYAPTGTDTNLRTHGVYGYNYPGGELLYAELFGEDGTSSRRIDTVSGKESELKEVLGDVLRTNHAYDALYRLKEVRDINNHATSFDYDAVGNVSSMRYPGSQLYQWQYDADHNLSKRIDALARTTNYGYDVTKSYLTSIDYPTGTDVSLAYDGYGRMWSVTDATGTVTYTYDDNDLVMTVTTDYAGTVPSKTISYAYNPDGSRRSMDTPAGTYNYNYFYDSDTEYNFVVKVSPPWMTASMKIQCVYDKAGRLIKQKTPESTTTYLYDTRGLVRSLSNVGSNGMASYFTSLTYDPAANLLSYNYNIPQAWLQSGNPKQLTGSLTYGYDDLDRLIHEQRTCNDATYAYDVSFSYDGADNVTQARDLYFSNYNSNNQIAETGYAYDANGNATSYRGYGFGYDYEDLPTSITGGMYGEITTAFRADGLRAWKSGGSWFTYYLYDGDNVICELDIDGNLSLDGAFAYSPNGLIQRRDSTGTNQYLTYSFDPLGSHVQTHYYSSGSGSIRRSSGYDGFGKRYWDKTGSGSNTTSPANVGFVGQWGAYTDHETRTSQTATPLVLMGIRYYDPITARFVTRDPMLGVNDYAYCENNPVGWIDPLGMDVGEPGFWESLIPVWGSGRQAIHRFQTGHPFRGIGNLVLAATDVALVRPLVKGGIKLGVKGIGKLGAMAAGRRVARQALKPVASNSGKVLIGRGIKAVNLPAWKKIGINVEHILSGHTARGARAVQSSRKSLFPANMSSSQIAKAIRNAYRYGKRVKTQGDQVQVIGTSNGLRIRMWVNTRTKEIESAWPY